MSGEWWLNGVCSHDVSCWSIVWIVLCACSCAMFLNLPHTSRCLWLIHERVNSETVKLSQPLCTDQCWTLPLLQCESL